VMMPGMDGFTTLEALRRIESMVDTPVVFVTAVVEPSDLALYDELGVAGVVPKPFDPATLPETLEEFWKEHLPGRTSGNRLAEVEDAS
jgi:two-component system OmpR family response regulator